MPATDTNADFNQMLKDYMPYDLLFEEVMKRDFFLSRVAKDQSWMGGPMQISFMGGSASSIAYGQLTDTADVTEDRPVRGSVDDYKEIWGTMVFNDQDLHRHGNMQQSFLKILPDRLEAFVNAMKEAVSIALLNGAHVVSLDVAGTLGADLDAGKVKVDRPARIIVGQYLELGSPGDLAEVWNGAAIPAQLYVKSIDIENSLVEFVQNKDLTGAIDFTDAGLADPIAAGDKAYRRGGITAANSFTSLREQLLSAANGGSAALFGETKLDYPHLQAFNYDGSGITAANLLEELFQAYNDTRQNGKGNPREFVMSYKNLASAMKSVENGLVGGNGAGIGRRYSAGDTKASVFGWTEIEITGVTGSIKLVGVQEMDDDVIYLLDLADGVKLHSNGFFERRKNPDGREFYETRATTGYKYFVDTRFFGELVVTKPSHHGVIHTISY